MSFVSPLFTRLRLRLRRERLLARARRAYRALRPLADRTGTIAPGAVLLCATIRNEVGRLPHFLAHHRRIGIGHFLIIDNASDDGSAEVLMAEPDVSVWSTGASYRRAGFGMDWVNGVLHAHARGRWVLTVDADEAFVHPHADTRPIGALTDWLEGQGLRSFGAVLIDLYPRGPVEAALCPPGADPLTVAPWFDPGNLTYRRNATHGNLWIQGGVRARVFFADAPERAPALNKIPLVRWAPGMVYASSTHMLLPRGLNRVYDRAGGEFASGALLHSKFIAGLAGKAAEELRRREHHAASREYRAYAAGLAAGVDLWCPQSVRYEGWRQLEALGLISAGNWA